MDRRTYEGPMDWEYQTRGPIDPTSPFAQAAQNRGLQNGRFLFAMIVPTQIAAAGGYALTQRRFCRLCVAFQGSVLAVYLCLAGKNLAEPTAVLAPETTVKPFETFGSCIPKSCVHHT